MKKSFYITTTLPYVNAEPHIGFALEIVQADVIARYHQQILGDEVVFNTGTDEHGVKIYRKAVEAKKNPQKYVDQYAAKFDNLKKALGLSYTNFIRTTDKHHVKAAQEFWERCEANGDIYKDTVEIKYCAGCELEKTDSEIVDGHCPVHPNLELELIKEENYFFKFSSYKNKLLKFYKDNPDFVVPKLRFNEIIKFMQGEVRDFSISRLKEKMPWGIPVPGDKDHVMYVWFDALINYVSTLGWPKGKDFKKFWPGMQVAGKDNLRQQSAMWQAMLMSAGLDNSTQILIHGFITSGGQKMSKSLGNVIDPFGYVKKYGTDAVRYYLLRYIHPFEDSDFTKERFEEAYTAGLSNGLGNVVSRVAGLIEQNNVKIKVAKVAKTNKEFDRLVSNFEFNQALKYIWDRIAQVDQLISDKEPWGLAKAGKTKELTAVLQQATDQLIEAVGLLESFIPKTARTIQEIFNAKKIKKGKPLFPRLH